MLIAKCKHCPDLVSITDGKFRHGIIPRIQVSILNPVLGFQTYPFNIMLLGHGMLGGTDRYMDDIPLYLVYRDMLLSGCFCDTGNQFLHFLTAAKKRNAFIPYHGCDISAMFTNEKFLLHYHPPP
jgi:hypothetical protein